MKFNKNKAAINLCVVLVLSFLLIMLTNRFILTPEFYENNGEQLSTLSSDGILPYKNILKWIYLFEAIYLTLKLYIVALILYTALYLRDVDVPFWKIFNVTAVCEYVFLIAAFCKILWFSNFYPEGTLLQWHQVYILSALSFFSSVPADWFYPLQTLNLFEVAYWFLLALGIKRICSLTYDHSLNIVMTSYFPALMIWVACVVFCTIMFFPQQG
jgi:hypothetical protein